MNIVRNVKYSNLAGKNFTRFTFTLLLLYTVIAQMKPIRICYQNLGHGTESSSKMADIEKLMNSRHPHLLYISETRVDAYTIQRFSMWNYTVETMQHKQDERIWAAVKNDVKYK